jgi:D-arabinitol dehydrogenase (NADP+)
MSGGTGVNEIMKALVYCAPGRANGGMREIPRPECGDDDVIIRVMSCGICKGVEIEHDTENKGPEMARYPITPGHEFAGFVDEAGCNVKRFKKNDRVTADNTEYCGDCYYCRREDSIHCPVYDSHGINLGGGMAQFVRIKKEKVVPIAPHVSFNAACLCEPVSCCIHAVDRCDIKFGHDVAVFGAGPNGLIIAQLLKHSGAGRVVIAAPTESKLEVAEKCGLRTVLMDRNDYGVHMKKMLEISPEGYDSIVDATGSSKVVVSAMSLLKRGGRLVQYAVIRDSDVLPLDASVMFNRELSYITSYTQSHNFDRAMEAIEDGRVNTEILVTREYSLSDYFTALDENIRNGNVIKVVIHPNEE